MKKRRPDPKKLLAKYRKQQSKKRPKGNPDGQVFSEFAFVTYGSLVFTGGFGNPRATSSYKSGGKPQSSRRRVCTSVNGDNRACVWPLTSTTLTLIVFITLINNSALGRAV